MWLKKAVVRDLTRRRDVELPDGILTDSLQEVMDDDEITVVAQLIGGLEPARTIMLAVTGIGQRHCDGQQGIAGRARCRVIHTGERIGTQHCL